MNIYFKGSTVEFLQENYIKVTRNWLKSSDKYQHLEADDIKSIIKAVKTEIIDKIQVVEKSIG